MPLTLEVVGPKARQMGATSRKVFQTGGTIGRLRDNDWVLPDDYISGRHAKILFANGSFLIEDTSTNGVFINSPQNRMTRGKPYALRHGDTVYLDDYEVRVTLSAESSADSPLAGYASAPADSPLAEFAATPADSPLAGYASAPAAAPFIPEDPYFGGASNPVSAPDETDPLRLLGIQDAREIPAGPSAASLANNSPLSEHYRPPAYTAPPPPPPPPPPPTFVPAPQAAPQAAPAASGVIPDDYDPFAPEEPAMPVRRPVRPAAPTPQATPPPPPAPPPAPPRAPPTPPRAPPPAPTGEVAPPTTFADPARARPTARPPPAEPPRAPPHRPTADPMRGAGPVPNAAAAPAVGMPPGSGAVPRSTAPPGVGAGARPGPAPAPTARPAAPISQVPSARPAAPIPQAPSARPTAPIPQASAGPQATDTTAERRALGSGDLDFAAMLAAAGVESARVTPELAQQFGQILRVVVAGLMDVLRARERIKDEFRMRMTTFKAADNNPLKFSANVEDALHNLLVKRNAAYLGPVEAFEDAFQDLRNHQMAILAGMRVAYDSMLAEFEPGRLQGEFDRQVKGGSFLSGSAKSKYWELYRNRFHDMVKDADTSFRNLFGDEFAKAYEEQLARLKTLNRAERR